MFKEQRIRSFHVKVLTPDSQNASSTKRILGSPVWTIEYSFVLC